MSKKLKANVSLTLVIIAGTFLLLSGITIVLVSLDLARASYDSENHELNMIRSRSCLEEGLERLKVIKTYTGTFTVTFSDGSCTATVINVPGENPNLKQIEISSVIGESNYTTTKFIDVGLVPFLITNP